MQYKNHYSKYSKFTYADKGHFSLILKTSISIKIKYQIFSDIYTGLRKTCYGVVAGLRN